MPRRQHFQAETLFRRIGEVVEPQQELAIVKEDLADNRVLEAALAGDADVIVSGDHHLLKLASFGHRPIVRPRDLLRKVQPSG